jgi:hypothetical protein
LDDVSAVGFLHEANGKGVWIEPPVVENIVEPFG